jgi:hypothetical protein
VAHVSENITGDFRLQDGGTFNAESMSKHFPTFRRTVIIVIIINIIIIITITITTIGSTALGGRLALLKQMSPATSILGCRQPISTTRFPCVFLYHVNPS